MFEANGKTFTKQEKRAADYGLVKKGNYEARIAKITSKRANTGTPYLYLGFKIREDIQQNHSNRWVWGIVWGSSESKKLDSDIYFQFMADVDVNPTTIKSMEALDGALMGKEVNIMVDIEDNFNGEGQRNVVKFINPSYANANDNNAAAPTQQQAFQTAYQTQPQNNQQTNANPFPQSGQTGQPQQSNALNVPMKDFASMTDEEIEANLPF